MHLLCTNPEEAQQAAEVMDEARKRFLHYATSNYNYNLYENYSENASSYFRKYKNHTDIGKFHIKIYYPHAYDEIVNILWDPNGPKKYDSDLISGKVVRVYDPNLLMIQKSQRCYTTLFNRYFYALSAKYKVSEDTTIIVMASANINDHNKKNVKKYENVIVTSANSFKTDVDSEKEIRKGKLKKMFVNLSGYLITKHDKYVEIIHIDSVSDNIPIASEWYILLSKSERMGILLDLDNYIDDKYTFPPKSL
ncbi:hypothetical protein, variant [Plasmodium yoelii 17X]|nr:hypothetical protein [Plasmodium yoelii yoelii]ETB60556.1 hypothetical protein, variant [Plasmodium yoelii 17X]